MVAFIGWMKTLKELEARRVGSKSILQYLGAVRQSYLYLTGSPAPSFLYLDVVMRAYRRWEEASFPRAKCAVISALA